MKMSSLLPEPKALRNISLMYGLNKLFISKRNLIGKSFSIDMQLGKLKTGKIINPGSLPFDRMNMYFLNRSMHPANEACNTLWATVELLYSAKTSTRLCKSYCEEFVPSSAVPTLHYANMAALLSILSLFGVCSIVERGKSLTFHNLIRTSKGIIMIERSKYLHGVFGYAKKGWHVQILQTYQGLQTKGVMLPGINIKESSQLLRERSKFHYDILGQTSMRDAYGVKSYFQFLPTVVMSIESAISALHQVLKPIPNECDLRFDDLVDKIPVLRQAYDSSF